ncbi:MAG TPA: hypothetical protein VGM98_16370 [Schlesneria sp.]|jgi:hypothetical protein
MELATAAGALKVYELALAAKLCTDSEQVHVFRLVCSFVADATVRAKCEVIAGALDGRYGKDPWRARGIEFEDKAREWIQSLKPPEMQVRTDDILPETPKKTLAEWREELAKLYPGSAKGGSA